MITECLALVKLVGVGSRESQMVKPSHRQVRPYKFDSDSDSDSELTRLEKSTKTRFV